MALNATAIATKVGTLSVTGVTFLNLSGVQDAPTNRGRIVQPDPGDFLGPIKFVRTSFKGQAWQSVRDLKWVYLHCTCGADRYSGASLPSLVANVDLILAAMIDANYGDGIQLMGLDAEGNRLTDPSGNEWFGAILTGTFSEFR
jgi:hypothetical protein